MAWPVLSSQLQSMLLFSERRSGYLFTGCGSHFLICLCQRIDTVFAFSRWRGRGKETHAFEAVDPTSSGSENGSSLPPPPPYQEREWSLISHPVEYASPLFLASAGSGTIAISTTPRRKIVHHSGKKIRRTRVLLPQTAHSPERVGPSSYTHAEPVFGQDRENDADDQVCFECSLYR